MLANISQKWREKVLDPGTELVEKGRIAWFGLQPRERLIIAILAFVASILLLSLVVKTTVQMAATSSTFASANMRNISTIQKLASELVQQRADLMRYDRLKDSRGENFDLQAFLRREAGTHGIKIAKLAPARNETADKNEEWFELGMTESVTLSPLIRFLDAIDSTLGVRIVELEIKTQFIDKSLFEVRAIISNTKDL